MVVSCAKEEEGRTKERKRSVEENGSFREQSQERLDRCRPEPIFETVTAKIFVEGRERVLYKAIKLM